jgi:glycosyltransferase involved in cell wall biosynthesis
VLHLHSPSYRGGKGRLEREDGDPATFAVEGVELAEFAKHSLRKRVFHELEYGRRLAGRTRAFRPDAVISSNTPLFSQRALLSAAHRAGAAFVFWQQDIISVAARRVLERRVPLVGSLAASRVDALERGLLRRSEAVVAISADFVPVLRRWGVRDERVTVIENWAPLDELEPRPRANAWARAHDLDAGVVFLYTGTLGLKHDPALLVRLAEHVRGRACVVVVSEGEAADWVAGEARARRLENLRVLPFQPYDEVPNVLATADVLVALLEPEAGSFSVPSKVLSYLCVGRPLLLAVPSSNLAARVVETARAGIAVEPADVDALDAAADALVERPELRAELAAGGRRYAERAFAIGPIVDRFEDVLRAAVAQRA